MPWKFDPIMARDAWLNIHLKSSFEPAVEGLDQAGYYWGNLAILVDLYLLGLVDRARPILERWIDRMEAIPDSDPRPFDESVNGYSRAGMNPLYQWQAALGLCKWLSRGDPAVGHFRRALEEDWHSWTALSPPDVDRHRISLESTLPEYLAIALAGDNPALGLKYLALAGPMEPYERDQPILEFGEWACRHLIDGGKRTAEFIVRGNEMLRAVPSDSFDKNSTMALLLKAIYWDSGMVQTPEQAILKAYDLMPHVQRPDFVPT